MDAMKIVEIPASTPGRSQFLRPGERPWLNLGCGFVHIKGADNADRNPICAPHPDKCFDMAAPWPLPSDHYGWIVMMDVLEHMPDALHCIGEAWRVLKPEGTMDVIVPHWLHKASIEDPTHVRYFSHQSAVYWNAGVYSRSTSWYSSVRFNFEIVETELARDEDSAAYARLVEDVKRRLDPACRLLSHMYGHALLPGYYHRIAFHLKKAPLPAEPESTIQLIDFEK
jgi:SAM-dependent methyltransferase